MKILVVDNNGISTKILQSYLESFSFKVTCAVSGKEAIRLLAKVPEDSPFKLVFIDLQMPEMDGIETLKLIKKNIPFYQRLTIIIMVTTYGREKLMLQAKEAGFDGFLLKPVNQSILFETIMELFGQTVTKNTCVGRQWAKKNNVLDQIKGAKILLVEDNKINQQVATELLEKVGFIITIAINGKEAVQKVGESHFDALLMDLQMPEMDGYEATRIIRNNPRFRELPIIAMTAHAMDGEKKKCLKIGMNDYTSKPIDPKKLFAALSKWIKPATRKIPFPQPICSKEENVQEEYSEISTGIDLKLPEGGISSNKNHFRNLWILFRDNYKNAAITIKNSLKNGDLNNAERLAHNIKGASGSLAARELHFAADKLEDAIVKKQKDNFPGLLNKFEKSLNKILDSTKILQHSPSAAEHTPVGVNEFNLEKVKPILKEMDRLLRENNLDAENGLERLKNHLGDLRFQQEITELEKHIRAIEFEHAESTLLKIAQELNISLNG